MPSDSARGGWVCVPLSLSLSLSLSQSLSAAQGAMGGVAQARVGRMQIIRRLTCWSIAARHAGAPQAAKRVRQQCLRGLVYNSATGTRTRVARVRAEYPNQLDYSGAEKKAAAQLYSDSKRASCPAHAQLDQTSSAVPPASLLCIGCKRSAHCREAIEGTDKVSAVTRPRTSEQGSRGNEAQSKNQQQLALD